MTRSSSLTEETTTSKNDANVPNESAIALQSRHKYAGCVPYSAQLEEARRRKWHQIKEHFSGALLEGGHSLLVWIRQMDAYLDVHRYAFSKAEHLQLVTGLWNAVQHLDDDLPVMAKVVPLLSRLLQKKHLLTREDFQVDWRPLYNLKKLASGTFPAARKFTIILPTKLSGDCVALIVLLESYYTVSAASEIIAHFQSKLCVYDDQQYKNALYEVALFQPVDPQLGNYTALEQWFTTLLHCWFQLPLDTKKENYYLYCLFRVPKRMIDHLNWEPFLPQIFDRLRHLMTTDDTWRGFKKGIFNFVIYLINEQSSALEKMKDLLSCASGQKLLLNYTEAVTAAVEMFIKRAREERKALERGYWHFKVPPSHRLTPKLIDEFAAFIFDEVVFERLDLGNLSIAELNQLALLCTHTFAEGLLRQKWALAVERASEPDRMRSALQLMAVFLYPVLKNQNQTIKLAYQSQMDAILADTLSSLSDTDEHLIYFQLILLRSIIWLKSGGRVSSTTSFDWNAFTESFTEACFSLVESNCEMIFGGGKAVEMRELIKEILQHSLAAIEDEEQLKSHIERIIAFSCNQISKHEDTWKLLDALLLAVLSLDIPQIAIQQHTVAQVLMTLRANILSAIDGETVFVKTCQSQLLHNLRLLQTFFCLADGRLFLAHEAAIVELLASVYSLQFDCHFEQLNLLQNPLYVLFSSLSDVDLVNQPYHAVPESSTPTKHDTLQTVSPKNLPTNWHIPSEAEIQFVRRLLDTFIRPQIELLQRFAAASSDDVEQLLQQPTLFAQLEKAIVLMMSLDSLVLATYKMPILMVENCDKIINQQLLKYHDLGNCCMTDLFSLDKEQDLFNKHAENNFSFSHEIIKLLATVSTKIMQSESSVDSSALFKNIIRICNFFLFPGIDESYYLDKHITNSKIIYSADLFKAGDHRQLPQIQSLILNEYHRKVRKTFRTQGSELTFTDAHQVATQLLLDLALGKSSEVRKKAQSVLNTLWNTFPGAFEQFSVPQLLTSLKGYKNNYNAFKGALYVLYGEGLSTSSPLLSGNWTEILLPLWPALVAVNWAEKPTISQFVDDKLFKLFFNLVTHPIHLKDDNFQAIKSMIMNLDQFSLPSEKWCAQISNDRAQISLTNKKGYLQLIENLLFVLNGQKLHWRYYHLGMKMLIRLIRFDIPLPDTAVEFFLAGLIHDSADIRETALIGMVRLLFQHCRPQRKLVVQTNDTNYRSFDFSVDLTANQQLYESTVFVDYFGEGFHISNDASFEVRTPNTTEQCSKYPNVMTKFTDKKFLNTFFHLHTVSIDEEKEESKRKSDWTFVKFWKYLFQSYKFFDRQQLLIFGQVEALLNKRKFAADCRALEVLTGLAKAMPWFTYEDYTACRRFFEEAVLERHLQRFDAQSDTAWYFLFYGFFQNRDLRRSGWVWKRLFEDCVLPSLNQTTDSKHSSKFSPITISKRLNWSKAAVQFNWRFPLFNEQVVKQLEESNLLSHPYKDVRTEVGRLLNFLFRPERLNLSPSNSAELSAPNARQRFVKKVAEKLKQILSPLLVSISAELSSSEDSFIHLQNSLFDRETKQGQELIQLLDTVGHFIKFSLESKFYTDAKDFLPLLPYFCIAHTSNTDLMKDLLKLLDLMAKQLYSATDVRETDLLLILEQLSVSWSTNTRKMTADFMKNFTEKNAFILGEDDELNRRWKAVLMKLLCDRHLTVRLCAQKATLYFWQLVLVGSKEATIKSELVDEFKKILNRENPSLEMKEKHGAILGLCAVVEATPDSVPDYLPSLLLYLKSWASELPPVSETIKMTLRSFRASHIENWVQFKGAFTADQLDQLDSVFVSNFYFV